MRALKHFLESVRNETEVIARFGQAELVKTREGKYELRGGSDEDRAKAREWISMFFHAAVITKS
jgi:hypothetical protein